MVVHILDIVSSTATLQSRPQNSDFENLKLQNGIPCLQFDSLVWDSRRSFTSMFWHDLWWFVLSKRPENFDSYKIDTFFLCLQPSPLSHTSTSPSTFVFNNHLKFLSLRQASDHALVKILSQPKRDELMRSKRESLGPVRVELVPSTAEHSPLEWYMMLAPHPVSLRLVLSRLDFGTPASPPFGTCCKTYHGHHHRPGSFTLISAKFISLGPHLSG